MPNPIPIDTAIHTPGHAHQLVMVFNLKIYEARDQSLIIGPPDLRWPPAPAFAKEQRPVEIPRIMLEEIHLSADKTRVAFCVMERWVAEQNRFDYNPINAQETRQETRHG